MRFSFRRLVALAIALDALVACAYDWDLPNDTADAGPDGSSDAASSDAKSTDADASSTTGDGGNGNAFEGGACDSSAQCAPSAHCEFSDHACGRGVDGKCVANLCDISNTPLVSGASYCGCDGRARPTPCATYEAGVDLGVGACTTGTAFQVACGYARCPMSDSYCVDHADGGSYECVGFGNCTNKDCSCVMDSTKKCTCTQTDGGVIVYCPS